MTTSVYTKTASIELLATQLVTVDADGSAGVGIVASSAQDVSTKIAATVYCRLGRTATTAFAAQARWRIEGSSETGAVNDFWFPLYEWTTATGTTAASDEAISTSTASSGQKTILMASTTGFTAGDLIFIYEAGTVANSEWCRVASVSANTNVKVEDNLTRSHVATTMVYDLAEMWAIPVDLAGVARLRVVFDFQTGQTDTHTCVVGAEMVTLDSVTTT